MRKDSGLGRPPVGCQFRMGQNGNSKGCPRKQPTSQNSAFDIIIDETPTVMQDGAPREFTVEEALQNQTYLDAIAGNRMAQSEVLKMIEKLERYVDRKDEKRATKVGRSVLDRFIEDDPENAENSTLILGIVCDDERWKTSEAIDASCSNPGLSRWR